LQVVIYHRCSTCQPSHQTWSIFNQLHRLAHSDLVPGIEISGGDRPQKENSENVKDFFFNWVEFPEIFHSVSMKQGKSTECTPRYDFTQDALLVRRHLIIEQPLFSVA
jgi:hypothetical protein